MNGVVKWDREGNRHYFMDGVEVAESDFRAVVKPPELPEGEAGSSLCGWKRPILSDALAVHPEQIQEAMERDRRYGIASEYAPDGRMILRDRKQRQRVMQSLGLHDKNGGYGDDHATTDHPGYGCDVDNSHGL